MPLLIALLIFALIGTSIFAILFFTINYRTIMSALAGIIFFVSLVVLPVIVAGANEGLQLLVILGIILIVYMSVGKDIIRDHRLNFSMGGALLLGIIFNLFNFCRRGY